MYSISDRIKKEYEGAEYYKYLRLLMEALCQYEEEESSNYGRKIENFKGSERRFVSNLRTPIKNRINNLADVPIGIDAECEFRKNAYDYAVYFCNCNNPAVAERFREFFISEENPSGEFTPDLIFHSPCSMKNQILYLEAKFKNNGEWFKDFTKISRVKDACLYLKDHVDEDHNPLFHFHVYLFLAGSLVKKIKNAHSDTQAVIEQSDHDIICIDKEEECWYARTLGEILEIINNPINK